MIDEDYKILPLSVPAREKVYREYWVQLGVDRQPGEGGSGECVPADGGGGGGVAGHWSH